MLKFLRDKAAKNSTYKTRISFGYLNDRLNVHFANNDFLGCDFSYLHQLFH